MLAALASGTLQAEIQGEKRNVRNISGPGSVKDTARREGWSLREEKVLVPPKGLQDGRWEVSSILSGKFEKEVQEGLGGVLRGMKEAIVGSLEIVEGGVGSVETMNVWVGKLDKWSGS